jgi:DNA-directed RNA polymerase specialized sigma24 family protein
VDEGNLVNAEMTAAALLIADEEHASLTGCLQSLTPVALDLVRGRLGGRSYAELCEELKLSESAAHKLFFKSKAQLQQCVEQKMS